ncbi:hypothetical protein PILCRDRAFT_819243 [Piloderma croceum F 1598]|uniref:DUF4189 domain-containing protein n=1 Tax=Piloderma croceum (strain F 1598) TaxID=765440 RepID=A0A0C3BBG0_PILCF|nr:hypothetical protein PILCRDRAFT_819243 [Piloderma croceum F 1598]
MKSALVLTAIAISSLTSVFGTPTRRSTLDAFTSHASEKFTIAPNVDAASESHPAIVDAAAATTQYWVCIAVSRSTGKYGWSQGGSESSALSNAKSKCGKNDCSIYSCQERGCIGIDYGVGVVAVSRAYGYGSKDGSEAASKALSTCKADTHGCGKPGYFCAHYIT